MEYNEDAGIIDCNGNIVLPALCHPHLHLDKCYLLDHCDANLQTGDFAESLKITAEAKKHFTFDDLISRGSRLLEQSIRMGITSARCHVEVDPTVNLQCLEAGLELQRRFADRCSIQIAVFAQDAIFYPKETADTMRELLSTATAHPKVAAVGSAPYVEQNESESLQNVQFIIDLADKHGKMLDFHLDYDLDREKPTLIFQVLALLATAWHSDRPITFGHVTKLTIMDQADLKRLKNAVDRIRAPICFVGLPTSDMHMMGRDDRNRPRGTLQCVEMIQDYQLNCAASINNCGNAFTPMSSADPLAMNLPVVYQRSTKKDLEMCYELLSSRARVAIGLKDISVRLKEGDIADLLILAHTKSITEAVTSAERDRTVLKAGALVSHVYTVDATPAIVASQ